MNTDELRILLLNTAADFKALDTKVLKVDKVCDFADYFIIFTGTSATHIQSLCEELIFQCKHRGRRALSVEGLTAGEWCLLDFGDIVVHVFLAEKRSHYDLEGLWHEAEEVPAETAEA